MSDSVTENIIAKHIENTADALIIVPPFAGIYRASLAAHILQACALEQNLNVCVLYTNLIFASEIGLELYHKIVESPFALLVGETLFSKVAFNLNGISQIIENYDAIFPEESDPVNLNKFRETLPYLPEVEEKTFTFVNKIAKIISRSKIPVIGSTSTFQQVTSSLALLDAVKNLAPRKTTIIGGANCDGEMAVGIMSTGAKVDYIFSGESEKVFPAFLKDSIRGVFPDNPVIYGEHCYELDKIPCVTYKEFYDQCHSFIPESIANKFSLIYETSRGCWWGEKNHCTFCGFTGTGMTFRQKSPDKVFNDLKKLLSEHPNKLITPTDNIMPLNFFKTFLPRIQDEIPGALFFYMQKANLTYEQVLIIKKSKLLVIQPGIESLSSSLLEKINKGVKAFQHINLLRYCKIHGVYAEWILIYGFPGDEISDYPTELIPLLRHFNAPIGPIQLSIDRFSPYFNKPKEFGIEMIYPLQAYRQLFPLKTDFDRIAFYFRGKYRSASMENKEMFAMFRKEVDEWKILWESEDRPELNMKKIYNDKYIVHDTRQIQQLPELAFINDDKACVLTESKILKGQPDEHQQWAILNKYAIVIDNRFVPLVTMHPDLYEELRCKERAILSW